MEKMCPEHNKMAKLNQWGKYAHMNGQKPDGSPAWCNKTEKEIEPIKEAAWLNEPKRDYDSENRGKIRSLLLQSRVIKLGLTPLSDEELESLLQLTEVAMTGKK